MGATKLLVENFFSKTQFPDRILDANEEAAGHLVFRVGTGRRSIRDSWFPTTLNLAAWTRLDMVSSLPADLVVIDRGGNWAGREVKLQRSTDNFAADTTTVFTQTIPSTPSAPGTALTAGVLTPEGAFLRAFTSVSSRYWRILYSAVAGERPVAVNHALGEMWTPFNLSFPLTDEDGELRSPEVESRTGWLGRGRVVRRRAGELNVKIEDFTAAETEVFRHIRDNFALGRPAWIVYDEAKGDRAVNAISPQGRSGFQRRRDWAYRQGVIAWVEHQPKVF